MQIPCLKPSVLSKGPILGLGYRSPWVLGNIVQAKIAKEYSLNVMLAQQAARELERTKRTFRDVIESAVISAYEANLSIPWGADGDHLKTEDNLKEAVNAGCTHFTYDVSDELKKGLKEAVDKICELYNLTKKLKGDDNFSSEVSLDETESSTKIDKLSI